jgi:F-type H+-transporting ATPase subunit delta
MNVTLVAERYATALFDLALEQKAAEEIYQDSLLVSRTCENSKDLRLLLDSPIVKSGKKLVILEEIFGKNVHPISMIYMRIMVKKNRENLIPGIALKMVDLYNDFKNVLIVHFKSPVLPDQVTTRQVLDLMRKYTGAEVELEPEVDGSLIGGFVLSWKDKQYDASIRREIEEMRHAIAKVNLYKKGF